MARNESPREDLIAEATALIERIEFTNPVDNTIIFAGFKRTGGLSLYLGEDPVYQFNDQGRLRRAFKSNLLYRSNGMTLTQLNRVRTATETILETTDLSLDQRDAFLNEMTTSLSDFLTLLHSNQLTIGRHVSSSNQSANTVIARITTAIETAIQTKALSPALK